jgi:hypothetical protein
VALKQGRVQPLQDPLRAVTPADDKDSADVGILEHLPQLIRTFLVPSGQEPAPSREQIGPVPDRKPLFL